MNPTRTCATLMDPNDQSSSPSGRNYRMSPTPGWYPDPDNEQLARYWDGEGWTEHRAPAPSQQAVPAPWIPAPDALRVQSQKNPLLVVGGLVTAGMLFFCGGAAFLGAVGDASSPSTQGSGKNAETPQTASEAEEEAAPAADSSAAPPSKQSVPSAAPSTPAPRTPSSSTSSAKPAPSPSSRSVQQEFESRIEQGDSAYSNAPDNEIKRKMVITSRDKDLCNLLDSGQFSDWEGKVESVVSAGDLGGLEVKIGGGATIATWNNRVSDAMDGTLIEPDSELYSELAELSSGDKVRVSGTFSVDSSSCVKVSNLTEMMTASSPDFIVRFTKITRL